MAKSPAQRQREFRQRIKEQGYYEEWKGKQKVRNMKIRDALKKTKRGREKLKAKNREYKRAQRLRDKLRTTAEEEMSLLNEKDALNIKHDDSSSLLCNQKSEDGDTGYIKNDPEEEFKLSVNELENNYIEHVFDPLKTEFQVKKEDNDSVSYLDKNMVVETSEDDYGFSCNEINIKIPCEICNSSFHSPSEFETHMYEHQKQNGIFFCVLCNMSFKTERILRSHKYTHTLTPSPTQIITPSPTQIITPSPTQIITSSPTQIITSNPTQIITSSPTQLLTLSPTEIITSNPAMSEVSVYKEDDPKKHERMNIPIVDNPFKCDVCEQTFPLKSLLDLHVSFHKSNNNNNKKNALIKIERIPVYCEVCNKKFPRECELKRHMKVHKPLSCKFCEKIFKLKPSLKKHEIKCANKSLYCKVCKR